MITYKDKINKLKSEIKSIDINEDNSMVKLDMATSLLTTYENISKESPFIGKLDLPNTHEMLVKQSVDQISDSLKTTTPANNNTPTSVNVSAVNNSYDSPWDKRLYRGIDIGTDKLYNEIPYNGMQQFSSTNDYYMSKETFDSLSPEQKMEAGGSWEDTIGKKLEMMSNDDFYRGVKAINNPYAIVTLFGSKGGSLLVDNKNKRRWYEVDTAENAQGAYGPGSSKIPSTQALISWGNGDPYGRTPYQFSDFVFCKHWNKIPNNRLITLRRFAAPILDNMNFMGMDGEDSDSMSDTYTTQVSSKGKTVFAPMATACTYFGEETGNKLSTLLKFKTGIPWEDAEGKIFDVNIQGGMPDGEKSLEDVYALGSIAKHLNIWSGNWNFNAAMHKGTPPPDPWKDGPYANRIMGPVNRIDKVSKRKAGIEFDMSNLNIVFEYCARPIGGINSKAALLDILGNFLVIGSLNAMFFGGQHRFMSMPAAYPFIGGDAGIQSWYSGDPNTFLNSAIDSFSNAGSSVLANFKDLFNKFLSVAKNFKLSNGLKDLVGDLKGAGSEVGNILGGNQMVNNMGRGWMDARTKQGIPYLLGMRALLTGEPVGEWHLTIGNPLNPIAMLGNLVCENIEVEFGDELGPDDFPTEMKINVKLKNAMARDRDAIQSIFNRGMGRFYSLPDNMSGSADYQTRVDSETQDRNNSGNDAVIYTSDTPWGNSGTTLGNISPAQISVPYNSGSPSVWNRSSYFLSNDAMDFNVPNIQNRSVFRSLGWIAQSALK